MDRIILKESEKKKLLKRYNKEISVSQKKRKSYINNGN